MDLTAIFNRIATDLQTRQYGDLNGTPRTYPTLTSLVGPSTLLFDGVPPRIVWIPTTGKFRAPQGQGGDGITEPRPFRTADCTVVVDIWNADLDSTNNERFPNANFAATENLLNDFCAAFQSEIAGSWDPISLEWLNVDGETLRFGFVARLTINIAAPLTRPTALVATVNEIPTTMRFPNNSIVLDIKP